MSNTSQATISYFEYNAVNELVRDHYEDLGDKLKAVLIFGPLVTEGNTLDIDLLEVIQDWQGLPKYQVNTSAELPLRGKLFLNFLSDKEFASLADATAATHNLQELRERLLEGYEIAFEYPAGYARDILAQTIKNEKTQNGGKVLPNHLSLFRNGSEAR